jgi:hypothetical protein
VKVSRFKDRENLCFLASRQVYRYQPGFMVLAAKTFSCQHKAFGEFLNYFMLFAGASESLYEWNSPSLRPPTPSMCEIITMCCGARCYGLQYNLAQYKFAKEATKVAVYECLQTIFVRKT